MLLLSRIVSLVDLDFCNNAREVNYATESMTMMLSALKTSENILGSKDPNRPFPASQSGEGLGLLKWRMQSKDESAVPLTINCWPYVSGNETYASIEYEASSMFDLQNVVISVPLPALRVAPNVRQIDGEWRFDSRISILEWSILLIDNSNSSGSMEFVVPLADTSVFFPILCGFQQQVLSVTRRDICSKF